MGGGGVADDEKYNIIENTSKQGETLGKYHSSRKDVAFKSDLKDHSTN